MPAPAPAPAPASDATCGGAAGGFRVLSASPLVFVRPGFASHEECECLVAAGAHLRRAIDGGQEEPLCSNLRKFGVSHGEPGFRRVYTLPGSRKLRAECDPADHGGLGAPGAALLGRFERCLADFLGCEPHADEDSCVLNLTPGRSDGAALEAGLHVDTYNSAERRFATAILYLSDLGAESGGQTVFPLAGQAPAAAAAAGARLLGAGLESTLDAPGEGPVRDDAEQLEAHAAAALAAHAGGAHLEGEAEAAALRPQRGLLAVFFTRGTDGQVDPRSWHGSAAVRGRADKWTLQTFKAAPLGEDPRRFAAACASRHVFDVRKSLPPRAFRAFSPAAGGASAVLGAQRLVEEKVELPGGAVVRLQTALLLAGPLREGLGSGDLTGLAVWPAATALAEFVAANWAGLPGAGRRVLDLGCGCGLVGLAAAAAGARDVVLLDRAPCAVELARRNAALNAGQLAGGDARILARRGSWTDPLPERLGRFGLVLAADVLYPPAEEDPAAAEAAAHTAAAALVRFLGAALEEAADGRPAGEAYVALQRRAAIHRSCLERAAPGAGLEARPVEGFCPALPGLLLWRLRRAAPPAEAPAGGARPAAAAPAAAAPAARALWLDELD